MVQLQVKGTKFPDTFIYEVSCRDHIGEETRKLTHLQNMRHKVRLQLYAMGELATTLKEKQRTSTDAAAVEVATLYGAAHDAIMAEYKDATLVIPADRFDQHWQNIKKLTIDAFPKDCTHADGDDAAVTKLWELHENPDIDEDYRLHVYHCRAIMDPQWRENEVFTDTTTTALWFCGKILDKTKTFGDHCNQNEKSKLTVKIALEKGPAPAGEPRMSYDDQRTMRNHVCERRETLKKLEDSELRDRVVKQSRGGVLLSAPGVGGGGSDSIRVQGLSKGFGSKFDETEVPVE
ncbi:Hypothetical protein, putative [Bodo saltans]|uniref:Uncharacterized protein n=1 Tax=Bodo saltans TaxID=75058 RepID=A0A0S4JE13_BODSA|nr:Hypothetical protein, putative [Bodo saltans]|eukprot:CUG89810.1 Hypothetical protein, putative [Bodo saltans]